MIREAKIKDIKDIQCLMEELEDMNYDEDAFYNRFIKLLKRDDYHYYVYDDNGIKGLISILIKSPMHHISDTGEVLELCVDKRYRNQKIGEQLLNYIEEKYRDLEEIELSSNMKRKDAHRFYEKHQYLKNHYNFIKKLNH